MDLPNPKTAAARLKKISPLRPTLAIVLGGGFDHALTELRVQKKIFCAKPAGSFLLLLRQHALDAAVGHEPHERDEHIQAD